MFGVLKHAQQFGNEDLMSKCCNFIDKEASLTLLSSEFVTIDRCLLEELVDRDTLNIGEWELFKAVDRWAENESEKHGLKADGPAKRQILGEQIVKKLHFPVMKQSEFVDVVVNSKILTQEETSNIMKYFSSSLNSPSGFLESERVGSLLQCCRFKSFHKDCYHSFSYDPDDQSFDLSVDKDVMLHGVSLFGNDGGEYAATVRILELIDTDDICDKVILAVKTGTFKSGIQESSYSSYYGFDVLFDHAVALKKGGRYITDAPEIVGPDFCIGDEGIDKGSSSGVTFSFLHLCVIRKSLSETFFDPSQFAEILFKPTT